MKKVKLQEAPNQTVMQFSSQYNPTCEQIVTNNGQQLIPSSPTKSSSNEDESDQEQKMFLERSAKLCNVSGERCSLIRNVYLFPVSVVLSPSIISHI